MQDQKWTDERVEKALEKSSRIPIILHSKARSKIAQTLLEENTRLQQQSKRAQKQRRDLSSILASLSNN